MYFLEITVVLSYEFTVSDNRSSRIDVLTSTTRILNINIEVILNQVRGTALDKIKLVSVRSVFTYVHSR